MRGRLLLPLLLAVLPALPATAAPDVIEGETAGVIENSCTPGPTCSVQPLTPRWAACHFDSSRVTGASSTMNSACWADVVATIGPSTLSAGCARLAGSGSVTFFSTLGGTWTVPVDIAAADQNRAGFRGRLTTSTTVVFVEGSWTNYCQNGWRGQFQVNYRIVRT